MLTAICEAYASNGLCIAVLLVTCKLMSPFWQIEHGFTCGPPCPLSKFQYDRWVPPFLGRQLRQWLAKALRMLSMPEEGLLIGQVGLLFGKGPLPLQEQHRDDANYHVVFLMRCTHARPVRNPVLHLSCLGCAVWKARRSLAVIHQQRALPSSITMICFRCESKVVTLFFLTVPYRTDKVQSLTK